MKILILSKQLSLHFYPNVTRVFAIANASVVCLSLCRLSATLVHPTQGLSLYGTISSPLCTLAILWPQAKFYRDRRRGTPPSGALNASGVSKYSDFGPIEGYIS